jgi:hypothetical protein
VGHGRAPGVQDRGHTDPGAQTPGICGDGHQGLRGRLEQDVVDDGLVLVGDVGDLGRHGEDHVIVGHWEKLGLPRLQPRLGRRALTPGAVAVTAGVVGDADVIAVLAALDVAAELGGAAGLDRRHDLQLAQADMAGMSLSQAAPCAWKTSATSRAGRNGPVRRHAGGGLSPSRSSGLAIPSRLLAATWV